MYIACSASVFVEILFVIIAPQLHTLGFRGKEKAPTREN